MFYTSFEGTGVQHFGLPDGAMKASLGDLEELSNYGLIDIRYGSRGDHSGSFRVTNEGYDAVKQIEQVHQALDNAPVTPEEGKHMGLDWPTDVLPVLNVVYELYTRTGNSVRQPAINAALGRDSDDEHTDLVLAKLAEGDWITSLAGAQQVRGPLICEPTPKTLELLANWPTDRGDMALGRLINVLEERIEATDDPAEKKKLAGVLASVKDVGESVMAGVLTKMITGELGGGT